MCSTFYYLIPVILISVQDNGAVEVLRRMNYVSQKVYSIQYTFLCYRISQSKMFDKTTAIYNTCELEHASNEASNA